ncbi:phosphoribosylaminoimidazolesuccinocarboxamide synthase [Halobacillus karajensis]|uniref:Phosphoribosylaminoimidazole-succinocarboxamide synthase n=1 Tax=Halobacillus karajensis TaxID=195088 RepID=A0A024P4U5_9BACI|nr:phosphoribosylaminoimidazolesuccinocarboxamide synthase [Halobacillus karajensis]CDQ20625.1 Phosphoribosylaminoimidazole-succinocarboxamide synthase [Halobacillus karajensis]CDQ23905.1 Phosphoribosylaminoimidazole-succinocarboxamide synthase [Halobacillus karajensis]CDQ27383.1 Phosphoribosylaminoimidazole-succinocarboxamide synthase [Halobacillus karajensis]
MKGSLLYEGKAKRVYYTTGDSDQLVLSYKDDATAFNGKKKDEFAGKGRLNNLITSKVFQYLHQQNIQTHFIEALNDTEQLVHQTTIIPLEVVVRNQAAGSITRRLGIQEKNSFTPPIIELFYKKDELNDPLINDVHAYHLTDITEQELTFIKQQALEINSQLQELFHSAGLILVDFKLEFGRLNDGAIVLSDEISPDTCRLWDTHTGEKMDKDVFREGLGSLIDTYEKILNRLEENVCTK